MRDIVFVLLQVAVRAPSNIALVKYMGKEPPAAGELNIPTNPSLSLTLDQLCTVVVIREQQRLSISSSTPLTQKWAPAWAPMPESELTKLVGISGRSSGYSTPKSVSSEKLALHWERVWSACEHFSRTLDLSPTSFVPGSVDVQSANTFPSASGIASSASFFAAYTLAIAAFYFGDSKMFWDAYDKDARFRHGLAALSRSGSGSSCRSFEGPWVAWNPPEPTEGAGQSVGVRALGSEWEPLSDLILVVDDGEKSVSSSEAHLRVRSSPLWSDRPGRARARFEKAQSLIVMQGDTQRSLSHSNDPTTQGSIHLPAERVDAQSWNALAQLAWDELWDMHSLFHTATEPFTFWRGDTIEFLRWIGRLRQSPDECPDRLLPMVTLDAGPNPHLLAPSRIEEDWKSLILKRFPRLTLLSDRQGSGARRIALGGR